MRSAVRGAERSGGEGVMQLAQFAELTAMEAGEEDGRRLQWTASSIHGRTMAAALAAAEVGV